MAPSEPPPQSGIDLIFVDNAPILVLGGPGQGKSSLLRMLAASVWEQPWRVGLPKRWLPIYLPLDRFPHQGTVTERIRRAIADRLALATDLPENYFLRWPLLTGAKWLLLLDGLDDVPAEHRLELLDWLGKAAANLENCKVVVASRPLNDLRSLRAADFRIIELDSFNLSQQAWLILNWLGVEQIAPFFAEIARVKLEDLIDVPWLLTMAALVYRDMGKLPESRVQLEQVFIDRILATKLRLYEEALGKRAAHLVRAAIERLALAALSAGGPMEGYHLVETARDFFHEQMGLSELEAGELGKRFVELTLVQSGLVTETHGGIAFLHATIQYHLAAHAVTGTLRDPQKLLETIQPYIQDGRLRDYFATAINTSRSPGVLIGELLHLAEGDSKQINSLLVAAQAAIENSENGELGERALHMLIGQIQARGWRWQRRWQGEVEEGVHADDIWPLVTRFHKQAYYVGVMRALMDDPQVTSLDRVLAANQLGDAERLFEWLTTRQLDFGAARNALFALGRMRRGQELLAVAQSEEVRSEIRIEAVEVLADPNLNFDRPLVEAALDQLVEIAHQNSFKDDAVHALYKAGQVGRLVKYISLIGVAQAGYHGNKSHILPLAALASLGAATQLRAVCEDAALDGEVRADAALALGVGGEREQAVHYLTDLLIQNAEEHRLGEHIIALLCDLDEEAGLAEAVLELGATWAMEKYRGSPRFRNYFDMERSLRQLDSKSAAIDELGRRSAIGPLTRLGEAKALDPYLRLEAVRWLGERGERRKAVFLFVEIASDATLPLPYREWAARELEAMREPAAAIQAWETIVGDGRMELQTRIAYLQRLFEAGAKITLLCRTLLLESHPEITQKVLVWMKEHGLEDTVQEIAQDPALPRLAGYFLLKQWQEICPQADWLAEAWAKLAGATDRLDDLIRLDVARVTSSLGLTDTACPLLDRILREGGTAVQLPAAALLVELGYIPRTTLLELADSDELSLEQKATLVDLLVSADFRETAQDLVLSILGDPSVSLEDRIKVASALPKVTAADCIRDILQSLWDETQDAEQHLKIAHLALDVHSKEFGNALFARLLEPAPSVNTKLACALGLWQGGDARRAEDVLAPLLREVEALPMDEFYALTIVLENMRTQGQVADLIRKRLEQLDEADEYLIYRLIQLDGAKQVIDLLAIHPQWLSDNVVHYLFEILGELSERSHRKYAALLQTRLTAVLGQEQPFWNLVQDILFTLSALDQFDRIRKLIFSRDVRPEVINFCLMGLSAGRDLGGAAALCVDVITAPSIEPHHKDFACDSLSRILPVLQQPEVVLQYGGRLFEFTRDSLEYRFGEPHFDSYWVAVIGILTDICLQVTSEWRGEFHNHLLEVVQMESLNDIMRRHRDPEWGRIMEDFWKGTEREAILSIERRMRRAVLPQKRHHMALFPKEKTVAMQSLCRLGCAEQLAGLAEAERPDPVMLLVAAQVLWQEGFAPLAVGLCRKILGLADGDEEVIQLVERALQYRGYAG